MNSIAIIPARGGSKRIPRKNIRPFCNKPVIAYSIEAALQSGCFDDVMVSTDDEEIAAIARTYGASVPFMRSEKTSSDFAGLHDVLFEVIAEFNKIGKNITSACCILPTAPLLDAQDIVNAFHVLREGNFDTVFPIVRFSYPILRGLKVESGRVSMIWPENYSCRSQDLAPAYHDCGLFYWLQVNPFLKSGSLFTDNSGYIELPELRVQDIDTEEDWAVAEAKYALVKR